MHGSCFHPGQRGRQNWPAGPPAPLSPSSCPSSCTSPGLLHRTLCSRSRALPRAPGSLGVRRPLPPLPARSLESSEVSRGHLASPSPSPHRAQSKYKQSNIHVRARGPGRGGHRWLGHTPCPCSPALFIHRHPAVRSPPARVGGVRCRGVCSAQTAAPLCLAAAGQVDTDAGSPSAHSGAALAPTANWVKTRLISALEAPRDPFPPSCRHRRPRQGRPTQGSEHAGRVSGWTEDT